MKTHSATEQRRPPGPAPGLSFLPRAAWVLTAFAALFFTGGLRAQTFDPVIDQVIAVEDNNSFFDHEGDTPAVIIIRNAGVVTASLSGWSLTDDPQVPRKWIVPTVAGGGTTLGPNQTIAVFASAKNRLILPFATNFLLPCGSTAYLYNPQSVLRSQKTVYSRECRECLPLFNVDTIGMWIVPTPANPPPTGGDWRLPAFADTSWNRGQRCLGYDVDPLRLGMTLYSTFDTPDVDTVNRLITDVSGPTLHTGIYTQGVTGGNNVGIPSTTLPKILQNVQFFGLNNINSFVTYPHHAELEPATGSYTFSVWLHPTSPDLQGNEVIFRKGLDSSTSTPGYACLRSSTGGILFTGVSPGQPAATVVVTSGFPVGQWNHLMIVISRGATSTMTIYQNGVQRAQQTITAAQTISGGTSPLYLARQITGSAAMYTGRMDDFITWNRALPAAEITRVFQAGNDGKRVDDPTAPGGQAQLYGPCIQTSVQAAMYGINTSLYERIRFTAPTPSTISALRLRVKYDDGFIAYINGIEVARRNAPTGVPLWNSAAPADRPDANGIVVEDILLPPAAVSALTAGSNNVLAIHAMNFKADDLRFLICPDLCYEQFRPEDCNVTTSGREFWITFPGNAPEDLPGNPLRLSVCLTGSAGTQGNVSIPGINPPFSQNFTLPAGGKLEMLLPKTASLEASDVIEKKGVRISANANIAVYGRTRIDYSTDTFLAHQVKCLGSEYLVLGWGNSWVGLPDLNGSQFGIVATTDNTHVTITPTFATGAHPAGVPYNFILNTGQTYLLRNRGDSPADLTGTEIKSDAPIAVFGGHRCANVAGTQFFCNTVIEQCLPVPLWNTEYCTAPFLTRSGGDRVRVLASENGTTISINGVLQAGVLNRGDKRELLLATGAAISSGRRILVAHISRSSDADTVINADPFQLNAQPTSSWLGGYKFCTPPASEFPGNYCHIIARTAEIAGVGIVPAPVVLGAAVAIPGTLYSYRRATLAAATTYVSSGRTHGLEIYGYDEYDAYGHSGGMGFIDTLPPSFQCPPDITIFTTPQPGGAELAVLPDLAAQFGITDNCCPPQTIIVDQNPKPGTMLQEGDYTVTVTAIDCSQNRITCIIIVHVRKDPRAAAFPGAYGNPALEATVWGWNANPDHDEFTNSEEYAVGTDMARPSGLGDAFTFKRAMHDGQEVFELSYRKRTDDPSLEYHLEGSDDMVGWLGGLGHFVELSERPDPLPGFNRVTVWSVDSAMQDRFFIRFRPRRN
jgi:IgGFc binding protein/Concanavalin A-like lectin/glucanases superfamily/HYR domain